MQLPFRQLITELCAEKMRLALTIIAIAWATTAITFMLAVGEGLRVSAENTFNRTSNMIVLASGVSSKAYAGESAGTWFQFDWHDLNLIKALPQIQSLSVVFFDSEPAWHNNQQGCRQTLAVMPIFGQMSGLTQESGRFINPIDQQHARRVIVLGNKAVGQLFKDPEQIVGKQVKINNLDYQVIGSLKPTQGFQLGGDYSCYIPLSSYRETSPQQHFYLMVINPQPGVSRSGLLSSIREILLRQHHLNPQDSQQIRDWDFQHYYQSFNQFLRGLQLFLGVVGFISLLVAGIGIANVMLVTVRRATRDIGVRMALGARDHHILLHYLLQAMMTVFSGGLLGILLTWGIVWIIEQIPMSGPLASLGDPYPRISLLVLGIVLLTLSLIGLASAYLPARQASRVDPVEALQSE